MFGTNATSIPSTFANDHRTSCLSHESLRALPIGECHFILLSPSTPNQRCACQTFHHNRAIPGETCHCGHQACYHVHSSSNTSSENLQVVVQLVERVRKLEETIQKEREIRDSAVIHERRSWEREVRILREALAPFYKSEKEMRSKLLEIEDKVDAGYDAQTRLAERVVAIDDASMILEKRLEELEESRPKRRRVARDSYVSNGYMPPDLHHLSSGTESMSSSSRAMTPSYPVRVEFNEARSSGILNLMNLPPPSAPVISSYAVPHQPSPPTDEARSSGFLALDLAERFNKRARDSYVDLEPTRLQIQVSSVPGTTGPDAGQTYRQPPMPSGSTSPMLPRRQTSQNHRYQALDMLAEISMKSSLVH